jgi:hypothetical protein
MIQTLRSKTWIAVWDRARRCQSLLKRIRPLRVKLSQFAFFALRIHSLPLGKVVRVGHNNAESVRLVSDLSLSTSQHLHEISKCKGGRGFGKWAGGIKPACPTKMP